LAQKSLKKAGFRYLSFSELSLFFAPQKNQNAHFLFLDRLFYTTLQTKVLNKTSRQRTFLLLIFFCSLPYCTGCLLKCSGGIAGQKKYKESLIN